MNIERNYYVNNLLEEAECNLEDFPYSAVLQNKHSSRCTSKSYGMFRKELAKLLLSFRDSHDFAKLKNDIVDLRYVCMETYPEEFPRNNGWYDLETAKKLEEWRRELEQTEKDMRILEYVEDGMRIADIRMACPKLYSYDISDCVKRMLKKGILKKVNFKYYRKHFHVQQDISEAN